MLPRPAQPKYPFLLSANIYGVWHQDACQRRAGKLPQGAICATVTSGGNAPLASRVGALTGCCRLWRVAKSREGDLPYNARPASTSRAASRQLKTAFLSCPRRALHIH